MATIYPTPPGVRLAYDVDGSAVINVPSGTSGGRPSDMGTTQRGRINDEVAGDNVNTGYTAVIFPEPRVITGWYAHENGSAAENGAEAATGRNISLDGSQDSVHGMDGTWTNLGNLASYQAGKLRTTGRHRLSVVSVSDPTPWKAIRVYGFQNLCSLHLYGRPTTSNRLVLWHPTTDNPLPGNLTDFGSCPRVSSADLWFRVKNMSSNLVATGNTLSLSDPTYAVGNPLVAPQWLLSDRLLEHFAATVAFEDLGPGQISLPYYLRRVTPSNAQLGVFTGRVGTTTTEWVVQP